MPFSLRCISLINVDLSGPFRIRCPNITEIWIGNRCRGWPHEEKGRNHNAGSNKIDGKTLVNFCSIGRWNKPQAHLPEEFNLNAIGENTLKVKFESFWNLSSSDETFYDLN